MVKTDVDRNERETSGETEKRSFSVSFVGAIISRGANKIGKNKDIFHLILFQVLVGASKIQEGKCFVHILEFWSWFLWIVEI